MTTTAVTSSTTSGTNITLSSGEDLYVAPDVERISTAGDAVSTSGGGHAIEILGGLYGDPAGIDIDGNTSTITVADGGTIVSRLTGIDSTASDLKIFNSGLVKGAEGIDHDDDTAFALVNTGEIVGSYGRAIELTSVGGTIVNHGSISSLFSGAIAVSNFSGGVRFLEIVNTGTIEGSFASSISASGDVRTTLDNSGMIKDGVRLGDENDRVVNSGRVTEDIRLGDGDDVYRARGDGAVEGEVRAEEGADRLAGAAASDTLLGDTGDDTLFGGAGRDLLQGAEDDDRVLGGADGDTLTGDGGSDMVHGGAGDDSVDGGDGHDLMGGGAGDDTVAGDDGNDRLFGGTGADSIVGQTGNDEIDAGAGDDTVRGNNQDDTIRGNAGDDSLDGGSGDDVVRGGGGADSIEGGIFHDRLGGGAGNDTLRGDGGDDTLHGGAGDDLLTGGDGADDFVIRKGMGHDLVTDFTDGVDQVDVRMLNLQNFGDLQSKYTVVAHQNAVFFDFGDGDTLMLDGVTLPQLAYGDFVWF